MGRRGAGPLLGALLAAVLASCGVPAQQPTPSELETLRLFFPDSEVFSPSKFDQRASQAPAKVVVVTARDIRLRGYVDLEQVLHDLAGFDFDKGMGVNWSTIFMRGIRSDNSDRFLLIWDGIIQNDIWKQTSWVSRQYPLSNIARIEVMYGPASLLYGANAFSGIVNVILKEEREVDGVELLGTAGSWDTRSLEVNAGKEVGPWRLMANARYYASDERDLNGEHWVDAAGRVRPYAQDLSRMWPADGQLADADGDGLYEVLYDGARRPYDGRTWNPTEDWFVQAGVGRGGFDFRALYWRRDEAEDPWYTSLKRSRDHLVITGSALEASYARDLGRGVTGRGYLIARTSGVDEDTGTPSFKAHFTGDPSDPMDLTLYDLGSYVFYKVSAREYRLGFQANLTRGSTAGVLGAELTRADTPEDYATRRSSAEPWAGTPRHVTRNLALFGNVQGQVSPRLSLAGGLRYDYNRAPMGGGFGSLLTFRGAAVATPTGRQTVKLLVGQSFQEPDPWHRFSLDVGVRDLRSPDLRPEKLTSVELDYEATVGDRWRTSVSLYADRVRDLIRLVNVPYPGGTTNKFENIGELDVRGLEVESRYFFADRRSVYLNATLTKTNDPGTGRKTGDIAPFKANAGLEMEFERWGLSLRGHYVSRRDTVNFDSPSPYVVRSVGGYLTADLTASRRLGEGLEVTASLRNLFDARYYDPGPRSADGRSYNGAILQQPLHAFLTLRYHF